MERGYVGVAILTVSDRCSRGEAQDESGEALRRAVEKGRIKGGSVVWTGIVPDDHDVIAHRLRALCDDITVNVVLTTGGTGLADRDVTPEATASVIEREAPGIAGTILYKGLSCTPLAGLSRGVSGVRNRTLIINFPGSKKASQEGFDAIAELVPHAVDLLRADASRVAMSHLAMQTCKSKVSSENVADRPRESLYAVLSVEEAQQLVRTVTGQIGRTTITLELGESLGYALAEDVFARDPLPPFRASIKDGYAVMTGDLTGTRQVISVSSAGDAPLGSVPLTPGTCVRINTGAAVPLGADAVVQVEDTVLLRSTADGQEEAEIDIKVAPTVGQDIRPLGSDVGIGDMVLANGCLLGPCELGVLATVGATRLRVFKKPVIGVLSTGNELQEPGESLREGKIRDSNRTALLSLLKEEGFHCLDLGIAKDDPDVLCGVLASAFARTDVVVTTGSVSMGDKDFLKSVLNQDFNATIVFGRVQMKPGKPTCMATLPGGKLWFGLPGNPVSCFVTCHLFVLPALRNISGLSLIFPTEVTATLTEDVRLDVRPEFRRALISKSRACLTGNQISSRLLSCVGANCLLQLPPSTPQRTHLRSGTEVVALLIRK